MAMKGKVVNMGKKNRNRRNRNRNQQKVARVAKKQHVVHAATVGSPMPDNTGLLKQADYDRYFGTKAVATTPTTTTYQGTQQKWDWKNGCHKGPINVFDVGQVKIWAGAYNEILNSDKSFSLIINCAGKGFTSNTVVTGNHKAMELFPELFAREQPTVNIDWPDGSTPNIGEVTWNKFANAIKSIDKGNVGIYCHGGHGRTGTALTILACLLGVVPKDKNPLTWLRQVYCDEAVETNAQMDYIKKITMVDVRAGKEQPSMFKNYNVSGAGGVIGSAPSDPGAWTTGEWDDYLTRKYGVQAKQTETQKYYNPYDTTPRAKQETPKGFAYRTVVESDSTGTFPDGVETNAAGDVLSVGNERYEICENCGVDLYIDPPLITDKNSNICHECNEEGV